MTRWFRLRLLLGNAVVGLGRTILPPSAPSVASVETWETRIYRQGEARSETRLYSGSVAAFVSACFSAGGVQVDRLALSWSNKDRVIVRTLGTRFSREQVARITHYKVAGLLVEFEDAGEVYDRCRYEDVMEMSA